MNIMATEEKSSVVVELYELTITDRPDDRFGRVLTSKSVKEDEQSLVEPHTYVFDYILTV
jgi:hypothetical protein